jgi:hypothetical protein
MFTTNLHHFLRLLIGRDELGRLPHQAEKLRVCAGHAWVSAAGRDYVVGPGETLWLPASRYSALVSAIRSPSVTVEVGYGNRRGKVRFPGLRVLAGL